MSPVLPAFAVLLIAAAPLASQPPPAPPARSALSVGSVPPGVRAAFTTAQRSAVRLKATVAPLQSVLALDSRPDYALRIVGVVDGTALAYNPPVPGACASVEAGQVCEVLLTGKVEVVTQDAAHPILVAQYMRGSQSGGEPVGDPAMGLVTPQAQALTEMRFSVHGLGAATKSPFVNIVTPTAALGALTLDGAAVNPGLFAQIGTTAYSGGAVPVAAGAHVLGGGAPFTAMVYQAGVNSSYLYPAASGLAVVNP